MAFDDSAAFKSLLDEQLLANYAAKMMSAGTYTSQPYDAARYIDKSFNGFNRQWPTDKEVLAAADEALANATSAHVSIRMDAYRLLLGQRPRASDTEVGLVSVRRMRAARKQYVLARVTDRLERA